MKKKNVLMLVVDELAYVRMGDIWKNNNSTTPFLDSISDHCIIAENMYSQAPYTESAVRGLLGGRNVLDEPHTMLQLFDIDSTCFDDLESQGYDVFTLGMDYQDSGNHGQREHMQLLNEYSYPTIWNYRLKHYESLWKTGRLTEQDYSVIQTILEKTFIQHITFYELLQTDSKRLDFAREHYELPDQEILQKERNIYLSELECLRKDKIAYINHLMKEKEKYLLSNISKWNYRPLLQERKMESKIGEKWSPVMSRIKKISFSHNIRNTRVNWYDIVDACREIMCGKAGKGIRHLKLILLNHYHLLREIACGERLIPSGGSYLRGDVTFDFFRRWYLKRNSQKPFFAYLHVIDMHAPAKITRPVDREEELERQVGVINDFIEHLSPDFKGSLNNDCTLRMVDDFIEGMFRKLEEDGMLDDTYVLITSDHGCSYTYCPVRNDMVNVYFAEQYRVPFLLYGKENVLQRVDRLCETKDIMPTLYDILGLDRPDYFSGQSILEPLKGRELVLHEYMGGGCPDIYHRPVLFCLRTKQWKICYHVKLMDEFENGEITEIHNLEKDPKELKNLVYSKRYDREAVDELLAIIKERFTLIQCRFQS